MTVQELLNGVIYAGTLAGALGGIGVFLHFAAVRPMRAFLRKEIVGSLKDIQVAVERNTSETGSLSASLDDHIQQADVRDAKIDVLSQTIREHIANGGHAPH